MKLKTRELVLAAMLSALLIAAKQAIAARAAEEEANRPKKINYGGLPGTKPKKRK